MPFGVQCGPAYFQRHIQSVLGDLIGRCCFTYIDDIIIWADDEAQYWRRMLRRMLSSSAQMIMSSM
jgi:hypothetical protein